MTTEPLQWRDILIDHAHGSGLALVAVQGDSLQAQSLQEQYLQALDRLLSSVSAHP